MSGRLRSRSRCACAQPPHCTGFCGAIQPCQLLSLAALLSCSRCWMHPRPPDALFLRSHILAFRRAPNTNMTGVRCAGFCRFVSILTAMCQDPRRQPAQPRFATSCSFAAAQFASTGGTNRPALRASTAQTAKHMEGKVLKQGLR